MNPLRLLLNNSKNIKHNVFSAKFNNQIYTASAHIAGLTRNCATQSSVKELLQNGQTEKLKIGGYNNVNYIKSGHGPHVVFCYPGILGSMRIQLQHQILNFDKEKFTFYAWDQPGYGFSRPPDRQIITLDCFLNEANLVVQLMKSFGHEEYSVMGWSGGGCSALFSAICYPQIVRKLVVWGAFSYVDQKDADNFKWFGQTDQWGGKMKEVLVGEYGDDFFRKHFGIWMDVFARFHTERNGDVCAQNLSKIFCPSLIIHGDEDSLVYTEQAKFLHNNIRNSRLHMWPKGKHNVHLRYPDQFNKLVQDFLLE